MTKVELFEDIRKRHFVHEQSIRGIAQALHVHRRMVRQALESSVPPARKQPERQPPVLTHAFRQIIDQWLLSDRQAPRKQRHTARRIFKRLVKEHEFCGAESTVRTACLTYSNHAPGGLSVQGTAALLASPAPDLS